MYKDSRDAHLIYFADKVESISLNDIKQSRFSLGLQNIVQDHGLQRFVVLDQVHGSGGVIVDQAHLVVPDVIGDPDTYKNHFDLHQASWFAHQGDFLITNQKNIALIILTADCVPLVLYDPIHHVIGLVHSGWKGSYVGVLEKTLSAMRQKYNTDFKDLICTIGPSAGSCCYQVQQPFVDDFTTKYAHEAKFIRHDEKWYFDNSLFLQTQLKKFGIVEQNIYTDKVLCTICNPQFCSFRKEKEMAGRQITMVALL